MASGVEQELKLTPADPRLLDRLATLASLGRLRVRTRRHERQRNSFFDVPSGGLSRARVGFRRRIVEGERLARWSLKGDSRLAVQRGVATRAEIEVQLDADLAPALALGVLRQAASQRGASALAEQVGDGLAAGELPRRTPYLEMETERRIVDLEDPSGGSRVELALDHVLLVSHIYQEFEIEAELVAGDASVLDEIRGDIAQLGEVHDSDGSKLSRAQAHLAHCTCPLTFDSLIEASSQ